MALRKLDTAKAVACQGSTSGHRVERSSTDAYVGHGWVVTQATRQDVKAEILVELGSVRVHNPTTCFARGALCKVAGAPKTSTFHKSRRLLIGGIGDTQQGQHARPTTSCSLRSAATNILFLDHQRIIPT